MRMEMGNFFDWQYGFTMTMCMTFHGLFNGVPGNRESWSCKGTGVVVHMEAALHGWI